MAGRGWGWGVARSALSPRTLASSIAGDVKTPSHPLTPPHRSQALAGEGKRRGPCSLPRSALRIVARMSEATSGTVLTAVILHVAALMPTTRLHCTLV